MQDVKKVARQDRNVPLSKWSCDCSVCGALIAVYVTSRSVDCWWDWRKSLNLMTPPLNLVFTPMIPPVLGSDVHYHIPKVVSLVSSVIFKNEQNYFRLRYSRQRMRQQAGKHQQHYRFYLMVASINRYGHEAHIYLL